MPRSREKEKLGKDKDLIKKNSDEKIKITCE